jgi:hypothetical protein
MDFLLGVGGQARVRDWLLHKWVAFEGLNWTSFSEYEATTFVRLSDAVFGYRLLSWKRVCSTFVIVIICFVFELYRQVRIDPEGTRAVFKTPLIWVLHSIRPDLIIELLLLGFSISLTRWLSVKATKTTSRYRVGLVPYIILICVHLVLLLVWRPMVDATRNVILDTIELTKEGNNTVRALRTSISYMRESFSLRCILWGPKPVEAMVSMAATETSAQADLVLKVALSAGQSIISYGVNTVRLAIGFALFSSYVFHNCVSHIISLLWRRVLEDQRGVFTLTLGSIGALAGVLKEVLKNL